ncbi:MAG: hypothetical protein ABSG67_17410 [Thermoguttaceae bacterium]|jgi:hypothetical protein
MKYPNAKIPPNIISVITNVPTPQKYRAAATMATKMSSSNMLPSFSVGLTLGLPGSNLPMAKARPRLWKDHSANWNWGEAGADLSLKNTLQQLQDLLCGYLNTLAAPLC